VVGACLCGVFGAFVALGGCRYGLRLDAIVASGFAFMAWGIAFMAVDEVCLYGVSDCSCLCGLIELEIKEKELQVVIEKAVARRGQGDSEREVVIAR
jgi:hypothetical protein